MRNFHMKYVMLIMSQVIIAPHVSHACAIWTGVAYFLLAGVFHILDRRGVSNEP